MTTRSDVQSATRLMSLDAYRGFVMLAMASGGLGLARMAGKGLEPNLWDALAEQVEHAAWKGCTFWDLIQPSFMFIVGAAMPFAYERRRAQGETYGAQLRHAVVRSLILVALGVFLASQDTRRTNFVFTNVLAQIGLGYWFVFLMLGRRPSVQVAAVVAILAAHFALFACYPPPPPGYSPDAYALEPHWRPLSGFPAHWEKNTNVGAAFDAWFLNRFPRTKRFTFNDGGYSTLNFIPSMATMLIGVLAGEWLRAPRSGREKVFYLGLAGAFCLIAGSALGEFCPVVKRIWTPSWVLYSAAWTLWLLALFYGLIDVRRLRSWAFPLVVVGMNSIAMYLMAQLLKGWVARQLRLHVGTLIVWADTALGRAWDPDPFASRFGPIIQSVAVLLVLWLVCFWMYRRRVFLKI